MRFNAQSRSDVVLPDGGHVTLRAMQPEDADELRRAFDGLSTRTRFERFIVPPRELSAETLRYLTQVDQVDHVAIVVTELSLDLKRERGLGVARFVRLAEDPGVAEAAVVVVDDAQRRGIGRLLLSRLADAARERGVHRFRAETLATNARMRMILQIRGAVVLEEDEQSLTYEVAIEPENGDPGAFIRRKNTALYELFRATAESVSGWLQF